MPFEMHDLQSVVIGNKVYFGGGWSHDITSECTVLEYHILDDHWRRLPVYGARYFSMVSVNGDLWLIGGQDTTTWVEQT